MELYRKLYAKLFGELISALSELDKALAEEGDADRACVERAREILERALREAEDGKRERL